MTSAHRPPVGAVYTRHTGGSAAARPLARRLKHLPDSRARFVRPTAVTPRTSMPCMHATNAATKALSTHSATRHAGLVCRLLLSQHAQHATQHGSAARLAMSPGPYQPKEAIVGCTYVSPCYDVLGMLGRPGGAPCVQRLRRSPPLGLGRRARFIRMRRPQEATQQAAHMRKVIRPSTRDSSVSAPRSSGPKTLATVCTNVSQLRTSPRTVSPSRLSMMSCMHANPRSGAGDAAARGAVDTLDAAQRTRSRASMIIRATMYRSAEIAGEGPHEEEDGVHGRSEGETDCDDEGWDDD